MTIFQKALTTATHLILCMMFSSASAQTLPNGTYSKTDFGEINMNCIHQYLCFATYEDGKSFLYLTSPNKDNLFAGYWAEPTASKSCPATNQFPNITTNAWGRVVFRFDQSGNSWEGLWGYCDGEPVSSFNGERSSKTPEDVSIYEESLYGSWLPAPDSGAKRNDLYTFNPDGSMIISDGAGWNISGTWKLSNGQLFFDDQPSPIPLELLGHEINLSGNRYERYELNDDNYDSQSLSRGFNPGGVFITNWRGDTMIPSVGDYALHYIILGQPDSFEPGGASVAGPPIYVEFWNETEEIKEGESGIGYRDDIVVFEPEYFNVTPNSLTFYGEHPEWGELFFSANMDGYRIEAQTNYELGGGPKPANADAPIILGDLMVKGHIFRDVELYLAFLH